MVVERIPSLRIWIALLASGIALSACGPGARLQIASRGDQALPGGSPTAIEPRPKPSEATDLEPPVPSESPSPTESPAPTESPSPESEESEIPVGPPADAPPVLPPFLDPGGQAPLPLPGILDPGGVLGFPGLPVLTGVIAKQVNMAAYFAADQGGKNFNRYILKAIDYIDARYAGLGYDINGALTRPIPFGNAGDIRAFKPPKTMCVAAQLEILLIAYHLYFRETGDTRPFAFLPKRSYERLGKGDLRGHIWVNSAFHSNGTADALINFGMGERVPFSRMRPGDFININRTNRTGHAVTFIAFIDKYGTALPAYEESKVIGFRYYSSQGKSAKGQGGFGFRDAVFSQFGCPSTLNVNKRDCGVIYSASQGMLTTGSMPAPKNWDLGQRNNRLSTAGIREDGDEGEETVLDRAKYFGMTTDD